MSIEDCKIVSLPKIADAKGNLTFVEPGRHLPFDIERVYYLYDGGFPKYPDLFDDCI